MVGRGEVLERMTTVAGPAGPLEALWQGGGIGDVHAQPVLLCPPHPRLGGSMDSPVLAELVWNLGRRRHPTMRFNFRGVSASHGAITLPWLPTAEAVDLQPLVDDAAAVLAHLLHTTGARTAAVVGHSVGALVAARLAAEHEGVDRALLIAPPATGGMGPGIALDIEGLARSGCPVSVVVGSDDTMVSADALTTLCRPLCSVQVIPFANHSFQRGLTELARHAVRLFADGDDELM